MRRRSLLGAALLAVSGTAACSGGDGSPDEPSGSSTFGGTSTTSSPDSSSSAPPAAPPALAAVPAWVAGAGEVQPEVKAAAAAFVESLGTWTGAGQGALEALAARCAALGVAPEVAAAAAVLVDPAAAAATLQVVYPQYGGLTDDSASMMTHLRQQVLAADGTTSVRDLTLDVRLAKAAAGWAVSGVAAEQEALAVAGPGALGQQVLDTANLRIAEAARADIMTGGIDQRLLQVLLGLAADHVLDVQVLRTGHPLNVYATDRLSNHSGGRAADIWRIDDRPVVDPATPHELLVEVMTAAGALGATEVGGPFDLNGDGPGYFTDLVHHDHVHVGITEGRPPADPTRTTR